MTAILETPIAMQKLDPEPKAVNHSIPSHPISPQLQKSDWHGAILKCSDFSKRGRLQESGETGTGEAEQGNASLGGSTSV